MFLIGCGWYNQKSSKEGKPVNKQKDNGIKDLAPRGEPSEELSSVVHTQYIIVF